MPLNRECKLNQNFELWYHRKIYEHYYPPPAIDLIVPLVFFSKDNFSI